MIDPGINNRTLWTDDRKRIQIHLLQLWNPGHHQRRRRLGTARWRHPDRRRFTARRASPAGSVQRAGEITVSAPGITQATKLDVVLSLKSGAE